MSEADVLKLLTQHSNIEYVINCIGIIKQRTDITDEVTMAVNAHFPYFLYNACNTLNAKLVHISTDCVFDGKRGNYNEEDNATADDIYGKSKIDGEHPGASVIRASFIGEEINRKLSLLEKVREKSGGEWPGYTNQMWNGVTALALAKIIHDVISKDICWKGVRHVFSPSPCSKYELVSLINEVYQFNISMKEVSADKDVNRILTTVYPDFVSSFAIPSIKEQIIELKKFDINNLGA